MSTDMGYGIFAIIYNATAFVDKNDQRMRRTPRVRSFDQSLAELLKEYEYRYVPVRPPVAGLVLYIQVVVVFIKI
jgi:hypothetical protein